MNSILSTVTTNSQFQHLADEWNQLLWRSSANSIFLTWEWLATWWQHFQADQQLWIVTARHPQTNVLLGIVPLLIHQQKIKGLLTFRECRFFEDDHTAPDHLDFIIDKEYEDAILPPLLDFILARNNLWDTLRLSAFSSSSTALSILQAQLNPAEFIQSEELCPLLDLPDSWEELHKSLPRNHRIHNDRRTRKLLREFPEQVDIQQVENATHLPAAMAHLLRLHNLIHSNNSAGTAFSSPAQQAFHLEIAERFLAKGWLRFYQLQVCGEPIAALYCFSYNNVVSFYQSGYDPAWGKYSPGTQCMAHAIQRAIHEGAREFDFLRGNEAYKYRWNAQAHNDVILDLPGSRLGAGIIQARKLWQRLQPN